MKRKEFLASLGVLAAIPFIPKVKTPSKYTNIPYGKGFKLTPRENNAWNEVGVFHPSEGTLVTHKTFHRSLVFNSGDTLTTTYQIELKGKVDERK